MFVFRHTAWLRTSRTTISSVGLLRSSKLGCPGGTAGTLELTICSPLHKKMYYDKISFNKLILPPKRVYLCYSAIFWVLLYFFNQVWKREKSPYKKKYQKPIKNVQIILSQNLFGFLFSLPMLNFSSFFPLSPFLHFLFSFSIRHISPPPQKKKWVWGEGVAYI